MRRSSYALPLAAELSELLPGVSLTDDELRFVAWFMTDGGFSNFKVIITQAKEYHNEIRDLLQRLELDYVERVIQPGMGAYAGGRPYFIFRIPKGNRTGSLARRGWSRYADYLDKAVAPALHQMTQQQFLNLLGGIVEGRR